MPEVIIHEADRTKHLVGLDVPDNIWRDAEQEEAKSGRWVYDILSDWLMLGYREAKPKQDHLRSKKVKA